MFKQLLGWAAPAGPKARLSVLIFHRVLPEPDPLFPEEIHAQRFDEICGWLAAWFNVLPLDQAAAHLKAGTLPARAACITFDDGYADNYHVAMPILQRHGLTATFFIATGFLDGGRMWNDTIIETVRVCRDLSWMPDQVRHDKRVVIAKDFPVIAEAFPVIASLPNPARYRTRTLNQVPVTASVARQSRLLEVMDCFTAFAMTGVFMESEARQSMQSGSHGLLRAARNDGAPTTAERQSAITTLINQIKYLPVAERITVTEELALKATVQLPTNLMMTSAEVKAMRQAGVQIGAHTVSHPILARLSRADAVQEIGGSKRFLEDLLGERVGLFAYPNGKPGEDYSPESVDVVRSLGFDAAVSTQWGASRFGDDLLQIKRFTPWDKSRWRFGARLLRNLG